MNSITTTAASAVFVLVLAADAAADSYSRFVDILEVDRHRVVYANVFGFTTSYPRNRASVIVWTRQHPRSIEKLLRQEARDLGTDIRLTAGPVRVVFDKTIDRHPGLVRISSSAIAILDFHAINYGQLKRKPAIRMLTFDQQHELSLQINEVFEDALRRYHNGRGLVQWLQDAWFDETGRRLFVLSPHHDSNSRGHEVVIIDLDLGKVLTADKIILKEQLSQVEPRFLHSAFDAALSYEVDGIHDTATTIFEDETMPLVARLHAAAHLVRRGNNTQALRLIRELSEVSNTDLEDVRHPAVSRAQLFDDEYWWNTIGYAKKIYDELSTADAE